LRHFTVTLSPESLMNLFEPQSGQIGQERIGSIINHKKFSIELEKH